MMNFSSILCLAGGDSDVSMKLDSLIEGISMVFEGEILKTKNEYCLYTTTP